MYWLVLGPWWSPSLWLWKQVEEEIIYLMKDRTQRKRQKRRCQTKKQSPRAWPILTFFLQAMLHLLTFPEPTKTEYSHSSNRGHFRSNYDRGWLLNAVHIIDFFLERCLSLHCFLGPASKKSLRIHTIWTHGQYWASQRPGLSWGLSWLTIPWVLLGVLQIGLKN